MTHHRTLRAAAIAFIAGATIAGSGPLTARASADPATTPTERPGEQKDRGRIQFAPGTSSGTVKSIVARGDWDHWVLRARGGQTIDVTIAGGATFELFTPSGDLMADDVTSFNGPLPADGDYAVQVGSTAGLASYELTVMITGEPASSPGDGHFRGEIRFAAGTDHGSVTGVVAAGNWDEWSFRAGEGQFLNLTVLGNATFSLYAPSR